MTATLISIIIIFAFLTISILIIPKIKSEPLGLPKGSVRSILTILIILPLTVMFMKSILTDGEMKLPDGYLELVSLIIGYYFGMRSKQ
ncbi:MAG: hypothetical protein ABIM98_07360 [candidate division WOR-3 bacterium]